MCARVDARPGLLLAFAVVSILLPRSVQAGCDKDTDCKGDRVCDAGECRNPTNTRVGSTCSLVGAVPSEMVLGIATAEGTAVLKAIGDAAGLENMPRITSGPVPNAAAMIYGTERLIVYSPSFMDGMKRQAGDWAVRFVFAHELGHHVEGHTVSQGGSNYAAEFQADAFASRVLKRMGASLGDATAAMRAMPTPASGTHPSSADRERHIADVFSSAPGKGSQERTVRNEPSEGGSGGGVGKSPPEIQIPQPRPGLPSHTVTIPCGCNGFVVFGTPRQNPYCASGIDVAVACQGWCIGGGGPWGAVCQ